MEKKCGEKPNCVSSVETRKSFKIDPIANVSEPWTQVKTKVQSILDSMGKNELEKEQDGFLHYVVTTPILRFKDDVYFWLDSESKSLHLKSESRVGYSDLGANRKRLTTFKNKWSENPL